MENLTNEVIRKAIELGGDLVGIAPVERFKGAPLRMSPKGLLPEARSVIVVAIHHPDATIELSGEPTPHDIDSYAVQSTAMNPMLDDISFLLARFLEDKGYKALPIAASNIWRYRGYKDLKVNFAPDLAHRYAAVAAGLGEIGWSGLCLTPQFGPRQRFVSIITDAELIPSPMYSGEPLCDRCMECVNNCPTDAFRKEVRGINEIEIGGKTYKFPDTNKWRCAWAENFGISLAYKIPEKIDENVILEYLAKYGRHIGEIGSCLRFCMIPQKRYYDISYSKAPRRKKEVLVTENDELIGKIKEICEKELVDIVAIDNRERFINDSIINPEYYLPDVKSIISIGIKVPKDKLIETQEVKNVILRKLNYVQFEITHYLDMAGYSAICNTVAPDNLIAHRLDIYEPETIFATIFTNASLPFTKERRLKRGEVLDKESLRTFCREIGADLVGFFNKDRYDKFCKILEDLRLFPNKINEVLDIGKIYGPYVPTVKTKDNKIRRLEDWFPTAKSVIVLGLHFPNSSLDTAKVTPAETVGPYAFVQYETLNLLSDIAYKVVKKLNDGGYIATLTFDIAGIGSRVKNSRGMLPDMRSHSVEAFLSGLAYIGLHGYPITDKYGTRQRFISIITDLPLPNDDIYSGEILCKQCDKICINVCPTSAIIENNIESIHFEGKDFKVPIVNLFACDWAKRYCLVGEEGPFYWNVDINFPLPQEEKIEEVLDAVSKFPWGVQKLHINIVEECLRKCRAVGKTGENKNR